MDEPIHRISEVAVRLAVRGSVCRPLPPWGFTGLEPPPPHLEANLGGESCPWTLLHLRFAFYHLVKVWVSWYLTGCK